MSVATKPYYAPSQTSSGSSGGGGIRGSIKSSGSGVNSKFRSSLSNPLSQNNNNCRKSAALSMTCDDLIEIKSKFDAEFRRFSISRSSCIHDMKSFRKLVENLHNLTNVPFTLCYTDMHGDLLPINNDENFKKALESARPVLRMLVQRKGESLEERYGYGTTDSLKKRNRISRFLGNVGAGGLVPVVGGAASLLIAAAPPRQYDISMPQDFRQVSAIIDVDVVPETHRRVRLCKHGSDKPLGFYIRDGTSVRVTSQGLIKVPGIFISRLVPGGLAESTGLLAINDEVLEVNGIEVLGKNLDQVTDMMVANASNLIITVRPADQRLTLARNSDSRTSGQSLTGGVERRSTADNRSSSLNDEDSDDEVDEIKDMVTSNM